MWSNESITRAVVATADRLYRFCYYLGSTDSVVKAYGESLLKSPNPEEFLLSLYAEVSICGSHHETGRLFDALNQLRPDERKLLLLIHLEGFTYAEIAVMEKLPEDAVRPRLHRIRKHFIRLFDAHPVVRRDLFESDEELTERSQAIFQQLPLKVVPASLLREVLAYKTVALPLARPWPWQFSLICAFFIIFFFLGR